MKEKTLGGEGAGKKKEQRLTGFTAKVSAIVAHQTGNNAEEADCAGNTARLEDFEGHGGNVRPRQNHQHHQNRCPEVFPRQRQ